MGGGDDKVSSYDGEKNTGVTMCNAFAAEISVGIAQRILRMMRMGEIGRSGATVVRERSVGGSSLIELYGK